jgi:hypothetical protein
VHEPLAGAEPLEDVAGEQLRIGVAEAIDDRQRAATRSASTSIATSPSRSAGMVWAGIATTSRVTRVANSACASGQYR